MFQQTASLQTVLEQVLNQVMEAERTDQIQATRYERSTARSGQRNGYKPLELKTRLGRLQLRVPQARDSSFHTRLFAATNGASKPLWPP